MGLIVVLGVVVIGTLAAVPLMMAWMEGKLDGR